MRHLVAVCMDEKRAKSILSWYMHSHIYQQSTVVTYDFRSLEYFDSMVWKIVFMNDS